MERRYLALVLLISSSHESRESKEMPMNFAVVIKHISLSWIRSFKSRCTIICDNFNQRAISFIIKHFFN